MLILTRRAGEGITAGDGLITFKVLSIDGKQVKIGINAPREISINRDEIQEKVNAEKLAKMESNENG